MKILLLTQWYPPEPMPLLSDMTETLQALGHEVTVLTGFPNWPSGKLYPGYRLRLWQREERNGVQIIRVPLFPDHSTSAVKRALNFLSFAVSATVLGFWLVPRPDVMHVIHPPITIGLPAVVLSFLWRIRFTLEIQDMWPENLQSTGMVRNRAVLRAVASFANWVYRRSAAIRVISPGFRLNLVQKGVGAGKIRVISNWVDTDNYKPLPSEQNFANALGLSGRFNILYAGTIGLAQGLDVILDAAPQLHSQLPQAQFVLAGDGLDYERLKAKAALLGLQNVRFLGRLPGDMMPQLYACADVLMLHLRSDPLFAITIPHKVFTYLAAGKPALVAAEGDVATLIQSAGAGLVCKPSDPGDLARAVNALYLLAPQERAAMGNNGRRIARECYSRDPLVHQLSQMIESAAA